MNIFFLDYDTKKCAEYHCDKHVVKMILETAQLLCGSHWVIGSEAPYKLSHKNHPCAIWVRESLSNYLYLCDLGLELCKEYTYRYGKRHKSQDIIEWCLVNKPNIHDVGFKCPPLAMPDEFKVVNYCYPIESVVLSYQKYYKGAKSGIVSWKNRPIPEWFSNNEVFII